MNRFDNFNRADNATSLGAPSDGGSGWLSLLGTWGISGNAAYCPSAAVAVSNNAAALESSTADVDVAVTLTALSANADTGIAFRAVDEPNCWLAAVYQNGQGLILYRHQAGGYAQIGQFAMAVGAGDRVRVNAVGPAIRIYHTPAGGTESLKVGPITDTFNQAATKHGIRCYVYDTTRFDDFSVADLAAVGTTAVGTSRGSRWDVRAVAIRTTRIGWDDRQRIGVPSTISFDVRTLAALTRAARGDVRSRAGRVGSNAWDARTRAGRAIPASWDARTRATLSRPSSWDHRVILGLVRLHTWDARSLAALARPSWWDVASAILTAGRAAAASWDVRAAVVRSSPVAWEVRAATSRTAAAPWDTRSTAVRAWAAGWGIRAIAAVSGRAAWDLASAILVAGRSGSAGWDVLRIAGLPGQGSWDGRVRSGRTAAMGWDVRALGSSSGSGAWDIASTVLVADVLGRAGWDIRATTGRSGTIPWDVRIPAARPGGAGWDVRIPLDLTATSSWDALARAAMVGRSAWDVSAFVMAVGVAGSAAWDVLDAVGLAGAPLWDVGATPFVDLRRGILNHLRGNAALTAIVGTRIYRGWLPQGAKRPAVTVSVISNTPGRGLDGPTRVADARIQIDAWADRSDDRVALVAVLAHEGFLHGVRSRWIGGVFVRWCYQDSEADLDEPAGAGGEGTIYRTPIDFLLSYRT